jgi:hypothetical protein
MPQKPNIGSLAGTWTYRSFTNDPDPSTDFDKLQFGLGSIVIEDAPMGVLKGRIGGPGWGLDLNGAIGYGTPWTVNFEGRGVNGVELWVYDYSGYVVPPWPSGIDQRPAIVGSIVRVIPHGDGSGSGPVHPAGVVASWIAVWQSDVKVV